MSAHFADSHPGMELPQNPDFPYQGDKEKEKNWMMEKADVLDASLKRKSGASLQRNKGKKKMKSAKTAWSFF